MTEKDAIIVDLNDWTLSGGGAQGDSYFHKEDKNLLLKLYNPGYRVKEIIDEIELTEEIIRAGVPCPAVGQLVSCEGRYGITFRRILNKVSYCKAISNEPSRLKEFADRLADIGKDLHSRSSVGFKFKSAADYYEDIYNEHDFNLDEIEADCIRKSLEIVRRDETKTLLHGDFHYGNVITDGEKDYFIDLGSFTYGNYLFDISMLYYCTILLPDHIIEDMFHITKQQSAQYWELFKERYFGADRPSDEELEVMMAPYCALRTLFVEKDREKIPYMSYLRKHYYTLLK